MAISEVKRSVSWVQPHSLCVPDLTPSSLTKFHLEACYEELQGQKVLTPFRPLGQEQGHPLSPDKRTDTEGCRILQRRRLPRRHAHLSGQDHPHAADRALLPD